MDTFVWKKEYELGITTIDEQHKELVKVANKYVETLISGNKANQEKLVLELKRYILNHFNYEENLMKLYDYKEYQEHRLQHYQFTKDIIGIEERVNSGDKGVNLEIMVFLKKWIVEHINTTDRKYVDLFKKRGQK